jgi:hypothetical protein
MATGSSDTSNNVQTNPDLTSAATNSGSTAGIEPSSNAGEPDSLTEDAFAKVQKELEKLLQVLICCDICLNYSNCFLLTCSQSILWKMNWKLGSNSRTSLSPRPISSQQNQVRVRWWIFRYHANWYAVAKPDLITAILKDSRCRTQAASIRLEFQKMVRRCYLSSSIVAVLILFFSPSLMIGKKARTWRPHPKMRLEGLDLLLSALLLFLYLNLSFNAM